MSDLIRDLDTFQAFEGQLEILAESFYLSYETTWTTGGMAGGNCWGGEADCAIDPEPEPEDETLVRILEHVAPSLTFIQYQRLARETIYERQHGTWAEYYGNYTDYCRRMLRLPALYRALREITA